MHGQALSRPLQINDPRKNWMPAARVGRKPGPALIRTDLFRALTDEDVGMGEVLRNNARGSYREIINIEDASSKIAERTYAVYLDRRPCILITEAFIIDNF